MRSLRRKGQLAGATVAAAGGALAAAWPIVAAAPLGLVATILAVRHGLVALAATVGLALVSLQTEGGLNTQKAVFIAALGLLSWHAARARSPSMTFVWLSCLASTVIAVSAVISLARGTASMEVVRTAFPYALWALAPVLGFSLSKVARCATLGWAVVVPAGLLSAVFFAYRWIEGRGLASSETVQVSIGLPSPLLISLALAWCAARTAFYREWWGIVPAALMMSCLTISGTRAATLCVLAYIIPFVGARFRGLWRLLLSVVVVGLLGAFVVSSAIDALSIDQEQLFERYETLLEPEQLTSNDESVIARLAAQEIGEDAFAEYPLTGTGIGYQFVVGNKIPGTSERLSSNLDTPVLLFANFGILGVAAILALTIWYWRSIFRERPTTDLASVFVAFWVVVLLSAAVVSPFSDKGFGIALLLVTALTLSDSSIAGGVSSGE